ncbi:MAG: cbb3-type cytochrome c oxidase subunit I [Oligoflexia bacterium]|nr:cbb3-type cytochrome c oxidase subunit I [Oligoflexia bacterium]
MGIEKTQSFKHRSVSSPLPPSPSLSPWWRYSTLIVFIIGFSILAFVTFLTYRDAPPIPAIVSDDSGKVLFTKEDIEYGQEIFLKYGLMEHGTLWGHGAYLGPDYTAEYLHNEALIVKDTIAKNKYSLPYDKINNDEKAVVDNQTIQTLKINRYNSNTNTLVFTAGEVAAYNFMLNHWNEYFTLKEKAPGLPEKFIKRKIELTALTSFLAWATWVTVAKRPGKDYSYTNNWPYELLVGNVPSAPIYLWSALSLITLLGGIGLVLFLFGKFHFLGWRGDESELPMEEKIPLPTGIITPDQWAIGKYLLVIGLLFVLQSLFGGALAHYRIESGAFYGYNITPIFPYNLLRTWHLQLAIFWIATAWIAGGLFLSNWVGGSGEIRGQKVGVNILFVALIVVVLGSLVGEALGLRDMLGKAWFWLGHQGSEYLDLGRLWQILLVIGMSLWIFLMYRALKPAIKKEGKFELPALFLYASMAIPLFYIPAFFYGPRTHFTVIDNWRFWIIHLWVEGYFELFATVVVAIMFRHMGLVTSKTATRLVFLDAIIYMAGGIIGTGHHWYFSGQGTVNLGLSACFSALEVVPLTLLTLDAWDFIRLKNKTANVERDDLASKHQWAIYFLMAVGVWNFVGAGVFGFLINLPIVSYYEIGTTLTANHAHGAMFGVFGMLALALYIFCLRALQTKEQWKKTVQFVRIGFWGVNIGLFLMIILDLFPAGVLQLLDVLQNGYWHARSLKFTMTGTFHFLEWIRLIGDGIFIFLGAFPLAGAGIWTYFTCVFNSPPPSHQQQIKEVK